MSLSPLILKLQRDKTFANKIELPKLEEILLYAKDQYYNTESPVMTDEQFDFLEQTFKDRSGRKLPIGAPASASATAKRETVKLPYFMSSLDKIKKGEPSLGRWFSKHRGEEFLLTGKIDGISALYHGGRLYTRGDGNNGKDISFLLKYMSLPEIDPDMAVRGELVINADTFKEKYLGKGRYKCARNVVAGISNIVESRLGDSMDVISDINFVTYEIPSLTGEIKPSEQIETLESLGFEVAPFQSLATTSPTELGMSLDDYLDGVLTLFKETPYEQDGVVIYADNTYEFTTEDLPEHIVAFKVDADSSETAVLEVKWEVSQYSKLIPVVHVDPVEIEGSTIKKVTAHNAKFIVDNGIGVGAIIKIIRSGSVIPKIVGVSVRSSLSERELLPKVPFTWDKTRTNILYDLSKAKAPAKKSTQVDEKSTTSSTSTTTLASRLEKLKAAASGTTRFGLRKKAIATASSTERGTERGTESGTESSMASGKFGLRKKETLQTTATPPSTAPATPPSTAPATPPATAPATAPATISKIWGLRKKIAPAPAPVEKKEDGKGKEDRKEREAIIDQILDQVFDQKTQWSEQAAESMAREINIKKFLNFIGKVDIKGIGAKRAELFVDMEIPAYQLYNMSEDEIIRVVGSGAIGGSIYGEVQSSIEKLTIPTLMDASGVFEAGIGVKRAKKVVIDLLKKDPSFFSYSDYTTYEQYYEIIASLDGFGEKLTPLMAQGLVLFDEFFMTNFPQDVFTRIIQNTVDLFTPATKKSVPTDFPFAGRPICITGFRDSKLQEFIESQGGTVQSGCNGRTSLLITSGPKASGKKAEEAEKRGIPIMSFAEFSERWLKGYA
jgi:NAD-dependent DNA ligase